MEYKVFEEIFKAAGFTERQMKKVREESYKQYEDGNGKKVSTGGQRKAAYDFLVNLLYGYSQDELMDTMWKICKATAEQSEKLYRALEKAA